MEIFLLKKIIFYDMQVSSSRLIYTAMFIFTILGFLNINIHQNFSWSFHQILIDSDNLIFWQHKTNSSLLVHSENGPEITVAIFFLKIIPTYLIYTARHVKDMYIELFLITGILSLWLISVDFQQKISSESVGHDNVQKILNYYKDICKLSKIFSEGHGLVLLLAILNGALYYSCSIGDYIFTMTNMWREFYMLEFLLTFSTIWALATTFAKQVSIPDFNFYHPPSDPILTLQPQILHHHLFYFR